MSEQPDRPLLENLREEIASLSAEMREMLRLRWELLRLEATADLKNFRRLLVVWAVAGVLVLTSLPLAAVALSEILDGVWHLSRCHWLLIFAGGLILVALPTAYLAWRRFRRRFTGLRETLDELREDQVWLDDWLGKK